jgi:hypothetical protein
MVLLLVEIQLRRLFAAEVVREENLSVNAERLGVLRKGLNEYRFKFINKFSAR